jgi:hypothetical protein
MFTWLFEFEFGDVTDAVVRRVTAVCDLEGVPSLGLTGRILINKYQIKQLGLSGGFIQRLNFVITCFIS